MRTRCLNSLKSTRRLASLVGAFLLLATLSGCGGQTEYATAKELKQSFDTSSASVKEQVSRAAAALEQTNYAEAIATMNRVVQSQPVTEAQKRAVRALVSQTREAINQNPELNSSELHRAIGQLILNTYGEN
jgi:hypothetical protein